MPWFFFNFREGNVLIEDFDGSELPDLAAARVEALAAARDILAELLRANQVVDSQCFEIMDEHGALLATVTFKEAMKLPVSDVIRED